MTAKPLSLPSPHARRLWLHAQRLDTREPFGSGPAATAAAVAHLGYVQIDTINVIERAHHHILFTRIPRYGRADLGAALSTEKSVFEYWAHALAYISTTDISYYSAQMRAYRREPMKWYAGVETADVNRVVRLIRDGGPLSIRDVEDDVLVEKEHPWASRKPSKAALQRAFFEGRLVISGREGMLKTYELMERHFGWTALPKPASPTQTAEYLLDRALRSQGLVNGASVMHPKLRFSPAIAAIVERRVRRKALVPLEVDGEIFYAEPAALDATLPEPGLTHILSPFDPLVIQRRRLRHLFGYDHLFEAYVPKARRRFGYFVLPVLIGDRIVAALDLKADRTARKLLIQSWHWLPEGKARADKRLIETELDRFAAFQFAP